MSRNQNITKPELIQLHQLLGLTRKYLTQHCDLSTTTDELTAANPTANTSTPGTARTYDDVNVEPIDINASADRKTDAIITLAIELAALVTADNPELEQTPTAQDESTQASKPENPVVITVRTTAGDADMYSLETWGLPTTTPTDTTYKTTNDKTTTTKPYQFQEPSENEVLAPADDSHQSDDPETVHLHTNDTESETKNTTLSDMIQQS